MKESLIMPTASARFVVTLPLEPSRISKELEKLSGMNFLSLTDTKDAFRHLANRATGRLLIMTPFVDWAGAMWAKELFASSKAVERVLIVRSVDQLVSCGAIGRELQSSVTALLEYEFRPPPGDTNPKETFHAKIVLADGIAAYVGSANFLYHSKESNLECGFLLDGEAVAPVAILVDAIIRAIKS